MPSRTATFILIALALVAVIGFGQGLSHAFTAPRPEEAAQSVGDPSRDPVPVAKAISGPVLDEARVREIAREEADAALARARPKKVASKPDDAADTGDAEPAAAPSPAAKPSAPHPLEPSSPLSPPAPAPAAGPQ